jgi:C-terminal processing protease CtpA/Prc
MIALQPDPVKQPPKNGGNSKTKTQEQNLHGATEIEIIIPKKDPTKGISDAKKKKNGYWGIGIEMEMFYNSGANPGSQKISLVSPGWSADRAGLIPGDIILDANGLAPGIIDVIRGEGPGHLVLRVMRGTNIFEIQLDREFIQIQ